MEYSNVLEDQLEYNLGKGIKGRIKKNEFIRHLEIHGYEVIGIHIMPKKWDHTAHCPAVGSILNMNDSVFGSIYPDYYVNVFWIRELFDDPRYHVVDTGDRRQIFKNGESVLCVKPNLPSGLLASYGKDLKDICDCFYHGKNFK